MLAPGSSVEDEELTHCGTPGPEVHADRMQELATRQPPQVFRPADCLQGHPESLAAAAFVRALPRPVSEVVHRIIALSRDVADLQARATVATAAQLVARRKELGLALEAAVETAGSTSSFPDLSAEEWALLVPPPSARGRPRPISDALGELHARGTQSSKATGANELSKLSGDEQRILFSQLCNVLDPGVAVALSSVSNELRAATLALLQQLKADHEAAIALCHKLGKRSCKELREEMQVTCCDKGLTADELGLLGTLLSLLPAAESLMLRESAAGPDGVRRLVAGLGACALPAVIRLSFWHTHVGDAGASALAVALGQGALPRLKHLTLNHTAIGDAGLVALAPAGGGPRWELSFSGTTHSATRASPPSWRRRRRQVRRRRRLEG